ncbi:methyltransferase [Streptomyces beihaiensis]|uniref:Methyltransferase n=1 Tax=Streptomyces beihaiensis TaxID=2984495 RepID=A0ABT3TXE4_9ACTN|nr:methyltransferase [Streptomyces beihaiensis]MCX3061719.1 methyltransferase [Streptomyces beihaiensis]
MTADKVNSADTTDAADSAGDTDGDGASAWRTLVPFTDLVTPMAVRVAATLRLADLMAEGVEQVEELARRSDSDADALGRMLRYLVGHGVFAEPSPGRFTVTAVSDILRSDHPSGLRRMVTLDEFGGRMDLVFTELLHTVRTGRPAWEAAFGAPFWEHLAAEPALAESFDAAMAASRRSAAAEACDWSGVRHVVDVGGGTGALLAEVLRGRPGVRGTLVDLPDTVARGRRFLAARGLEERCAFAGQSFFDPLPADGDVYVLSAVLHDWDDERATAILRRCAEAAGPAGRVLVVESHGTAGDDPAMFAEMNLRMLVISGGRERTIESYRALATAAGLTATDVRTTPSGLVVLDCRAA